MDRVWDGMTVQQACDVLDYPYSELRWHWFSGKWEDHKRVILDTAMLADYRDREVLSER